MEWFLLTIQGKRVFTDLEDTTLLGKSKNGSFLLSPFVVLWRQGM